MLKLWEHFAGGAMARDFRTVMAVVAAACLFHGCRAADAPPPRRPQNGPAVNTAAPAAPEKVTLPSQSDEFISFEGGLKVYPALKRVELEATLLGGQRRPLEFLIVGPGGSAHEALFTVTARSEHVKRGLEIIGLTEAAVKAQGRGYPEVPQGDGVRISVRFTHRDTGNVTMARVEDWLWNAVEKRPPEYGMFVFTGGIEQYMPEANRSVVAADQLGNMAAVWHDASCIIDNRAKHGAVSDVYSPNPDAPGLPRAGAHVVLVFEPEKP
ncbi:MAG: hypothetical protein DCC64_06715 [Planctomycetota bacterium]|nr:MAG: hypothetical protein DCC64_06715 [Planctomycetota bacterium]